MWSCVLIRCSVDTTSLSIARVCSAVTASDLDALTEQSQRASLTISIIKPRFNDPPPTLHIYLILEVRFQESDRCAK